MARGFASWLHEAGKFYLMYLGVGAAFAPFGLVYGLLAVNGWDHWLVGVALLAAGFLTAHFVWGCLQARFFKPLSPTAKRYLSASAAVPKFVRQLAIQAGVATILVQITYPPVDKERSAVAEIFGPTYSQIVGSTETIALPV
jgi:hypothetical protein